MTKPSRLNHQSRRQTKANSAIITIVNGKLGKNIITTSGKKLFKYSGESIKREHKLFLNKSDEPAVRQLTIEYFANRPELTQDKKARAEAIKQLSSSLLCPIQYIRRYVVEAGLIPAHKSTTDGSQYRYVNEHLEELLQKYYNGQEINLPQYSIDIMLYLAGMPEKIHVNNIHGISKRVAQLNLPVRKTKFIPA